MDMPLPGDEPAPPPVPLAVRAQLLATEHWGLLASRSTTQAEVLTRISIFLTLVSAGLVSLALLGQVTRFAGPFPGFAVAVLGIVALMGVLTQVRVSNVGMDDLMYVLAMNRLRAAYVDIDPGVAPYLMASTHDDFAGTTRTYYFLGRRSGASQLLGSSTIFIVAVNAALVGLLVAAIIFTVAGAVVASAFGIVAGVAYILVSLALGVRQFAAAWAAHTPLNPSPADAG
ncbi:hypothetical protein [Marisediminicola senii]|uniref:hypothetical protein n=1 Tax=Marisediminicola senii TaxID=2711233 RepID=UPI001F23FDEE|nr:hypothetical protein [Marisediminicola senii]